MELADSDTGRSMLRFLALAAGEGAEEVVSDLLSPLAEATYRDESLGELYRQREPEDLLCDYLIGASVSILASGASAMAGQRAEASAEYRANEAEYFNILERNGHLESKNAAPDGTAEEEQVVAAQRHLQPESSGFQSKVVCHSHKNRSRRLRKGEFPKWDVPLSGIGFRTQANRSFSESQPKG